MATTVTVKTGSNPAEVSTYTEDANGSFSLSTDTVSANSEKTFTVPSLQQISVLEMPQPI